MKMECKAYSRYFTSNFFLLKESSPQGSLNSPGIKWDREIVVHSVVGPPLISTYQELGQLVQAVPNHKEQLSFLIHLLFYFLHF